MSPGPRVRFINSLRGSHLQAEKLDVVRQGRLRHQRPRRQLPARVRAFQLFKVRQSLMKPRNGSDQNKFISREKGQPPYSERPSV